MPSAIDRALDRVLTDTTDSARQLDIATHRYVIFSDQHKGQRDGADDFRRCEAAFPRGRERWE